MKPVAYVVLLTLLSHAGFVGCRITVSLSALSQHASPLSVGVLMALYAAIPMLLSVQAGRLVDRIGAYRPIAVSSALVTAGILLPFAWPAIEALFVSAVIVGSAFMMQHIALNHVIGSLGDPADRPVNFSWFALGYSVSGFAGPLIAGFAIDLTGHRTAFLLLALAAARFLHAVPVAPPALAAPQPPRAGAAEHRVTDLLPAEPACCRFPLQPACRDRWDLYFFAFRSSAPASTSRPTIGVVMSQLRAPRPSFVPCSCRRCRGPPLGVDPWYARPGVAAPPIRSFRW